MIPAGRCEAICRGCPCYREIRRPFGDRPFCYCKCDQRTNILEILRVPYGDAAIPPKCRHYAAQVAAVTGRPLSIGQRLRLWFDRLCHLLKSRLGCFFRRKCN